MPKSKFAVGKYLLIILPLVSVVAVGIVYSWTPQHPVAPPVQAPCADPAKQQRLPYRDSTACFTNEFAEFLGCLEMSKLSEIANDARKTIEGSGSLKEGQLNASAKAETSAVGSIKLKYSADPLTAAVAACVKKYEGPTPAPPNPPNPAPSKGPPMKRISAACHADSHTGQWYIYCKCNGGETSDPLAVESKAGSDSPGLQSAIDDYFRRHPDQCK